VKPLFTRRELFTWLLSLTLVCAAGCLTVMLISNDVSILDLILDILLFTPFLWIVGLFGWCLASGKPLLRHRFWISLIAPACLSFGAAAGLLRDRKNPGHRFESVTHDKLPPHAFNLRCQLNGAWYDDVHDWYSFEAPPEEVEDLMNRLGVERRSPAGKPVPSVSPVPGDGAPWEGLESWQGSFMTISTNVPHTRVFITYWLP